MAARGRGALATSAPSEEASPASPSAFDPITYESPSLHLGVLGTYRSGVFGNDTAASVAHDPETQRLFVANEGENQLDVLDIRDPEHPSLLFSLDLSPYGSLPTHVAVSNGRIALTTENEFDPGKVLFFDTRLAAGDEPLNAVTVGISPDMLLFTLDGRKVLVASEGRPSDDYTIDPLGSISIIDLQKGVGSATVDTLDFTAFDDQKETLIEAGVRIYGPNLATPDPGDTATVAQDLEPEFITVSPDGGVAWVVLQENNALALVDVAQGAVTGIRPLGAKDHSLLGNGLDPSDEDGGINIRSWPVNGLYQPDGLASYQAFGETFLVTANEGNSRETAGFSEVGRVRDVTLDPVAFPNAADLQQDETLGRLEITTVDGDTDGDGDFDQLYSFGGRSFSIWSADGQLVFDSGDDIEQIIAAAVPGNFNSQSDQNTFDDRSDDDGPAPHSVVTGDVAGRSYAFIALENMGGIIVYDVTNPYVPSFKQYINNRNFSVDVDEVCDEGQPVSCQCQAVGDLEPDGLFFIHASKSPIGVPLLAVANEASGTTTLYEIDADTAPAPSADFLFI
jgi:hypothetical protein